MEVGLKSFMHNVRTGVAAAGMGAATVLGGCKEAPPLYDGAFSPVVQFYSGMGERAKFVADSVATDYTIKKSIMSEAAADAYLKTANSAIDSVYLADSCKAKTPFMLKEAKDARNNAKMLTEGLYDMKKMFGGYIDSKDVLAVDSIIDRTLGGNNNILRKTGQLMDSVLKVAKKVR